MAQRKPTDPAKIPVKPEDREELYKYIIGVKEIFNTADDGTKANNQHPGAQDELQKARNVIYQQAAVMERELASNRFTVKTEQDLEEKAEKLITAFATIRSHEGFDRHRRQHSETINDLTRFLHTKKLSELPQVNETGPTPEIEQYKTKAEQRYDNNVPDNFMFRDKTNNYENHANAIIERLANLELDKKEEKLKQLNDLKQFAENFKTNNDDPRAKEGGWAVLYQLEKLQALNPVDKTDKISKRTIGAISDTTRDALKAIQDDLGALAASLESHLQRNPDQSHNLPKTKKFDKLIEESLKLRQPLDSNRPAVEDVGALDYETHRPSLPLASGKSIREV